jgi:hypothetical protein
MEEIPCLEGCIFSLGGCSFSRDGILGYQFDKRLESFVPCSSQSLLLADFYRKPYSSFILQQHMKTILTLLLKIRTIKSKKHKNSSLFMNSFSKNVKTEKNPSLRRLEFMAHKPRLKMPFKNSISGTSVAEEEDSHFLERKQYHLVEAEI